MTKKPRSTRAKARLATLRRDPLGRLGLEVARYLAPHGWTVLVVGNAEVRGVGEGKPGPYEFTVSFTGARSANWRTVKAEGR